jgi:hypothetical protein
MSSIFQKTTVSKSSHDFFTNSIVTRLSFHHQTAIKALFFASKSIFLYDFSQATIKLKSHFGEILFL